MARFRIAHLSDLHVAHVTANLRRLGRMLLPGEGGWWDVLARLAASSLERKSLFEPLTRSTHLAYKYDPRLLSAVLSDVRRSAADYAVVTGDLSNLGATSELREAVQTLAAFGFTRERCTIVPGNHDRINFSGTADWKRTLGAREYPHVDRAAEGIFVVAVDSTAHGDDLDWRDMVALNSRGRIGVDQIEKADALLAELPRDAMKILAVHHHLVDLPPDGYIDDWADKLDPRLAAKAEGSEVLLDVAVARGVGLILFGHRHRPTRDDFLIRGIPAACSGAVAQPDPSGVLKYRTFDFDGPRLVGRAWHSIEPSVALATCEKPVTAPDSGDDDLRATVAIDGGDLEGSLQKLRGKRRELDRRALEELAARARKK